MWWFFVFLVISIIQKTKGEGKRRCARFFSGSFAVITARFAAKLCTPYFNRETYRVAKKKKGTIRRAKQNSFSRLKSLTVIASREITRNLFVGSLHVYEMFERCILQIQSLISRARRESRNVCGKAHVRTFIYVANVV